MKVQLTNNFGYRNISIQSGQDSFDSAWGGDVMNRIVKFINYLSPCAQSSKDGIGFET